MSARAPEIVFLPGFDGAAHLREPFVAGLRASHAARGIDYPNRRLESLNGYCRFASSQVAPDSRQILVAESFSGLIAARWASMDPHVEALVLCGSFARNPVHWLASVGATMPNLVKYATSLFGPMALTTLDPSRRRWSEDLARALQALEAGVVAERLQLVAREDVSAELRALRIPIVLVQFENDLVVGPFAQRNLEAVCHNAQVVRFPGPHFSIETMPRECAAAVGARIRSIAITRT
jgi:pimeloyl-ACP methyl ester carboxylesterase